jgi:hypothetical protein
VVKLATTAGISINAVACAYYLADTALCWPHCDGVFAPLLRFGSNVELSSVRVLLLDVQRSR